MTIWFLDASVLLASEDPDDENCADANRLLLSSEPLATLDLAFYEVTNVALRAWNDEPAARRLRERVAAIGEDGGLLRASVDPLAGAAAVAGTHGISVYVAAARTANAELVSCDRRDLVSRGLARLPGSALIA
ncbi:MAG: hypothetical protein ACRDHX_17760 [Chloroflexota bacterium]